jgi:hypothetical protein
LTCIDLAPEPSRHSALNDWRSRSSERSPRAKLVPSKKALRSAAVPIRDFRPLIVLHFGLYQQLY